MSSQKAPPPESALQPARRAASAPQSRKPENDAENDVTRRKRAFSVGQKLRRFIFKR
jgi:hypothetical protein